MNEKCFYPHTGGYAAAVAFMTDKENEGYKVTLIGHPSYQSQIVRYWKE